MRAGYTFTGVTVGYPERLDEVRVDLSSVLAWATAMVSLTGNARLLPDPAGPTDVPGTAFVAPVTGRVPGSAPFAARQDALWRHGVQVVGDLDEAWRRTRDATLTAARSFYEVDSSAEEALRRAVQHLDDGAEGL